MSSSTRIQPGRSRSSERKPTRLSTATGSATGSRSNTRREPDSALSKPRMCLMSVVLPAPLAPTRPNTCPRSTLRLTPSSASFDLNRRERPLMTTTGWLGEEAGMFIFMGKSVGCGADRAVGRQVLPLPRSGGEDKGEGEIATSSACSAATPHPDPLPFRRGEGRPRPVSVVYPVVSYLFL